MKHAANPTRTFAIFILITLVVYYSSLFDYHQFLLPSPEQSIVECRLLNLTLERNGTITDRPDGYIKKPTGGEAKMYFYATNLWKEIQCDSRKYLYHNLYLDILRVDVEEEMEKTREKYKLSGVRVRWRYDREKYSYLLGGVQLDRYGFVDEPLDIYQNYKPWVILSWFLILVFGLFLTSLVISLLSFLSARKQHYNVSSFPERDQDLDSHSL